MTRLLFALALVAAAGGAAWADDTRVRTSATVEVIDDKAQIDDVISRLRTQQALDKREAGDAAAGGQPQGRAAGAADVDRVRLLASRGRPGAQGAAHRLAPRQPRARQPRPHRASQATSTVGE